MAEVFTFVDPGRQKRARDEADRERKLFMSSKASDLLKRPPPKPKTLKRKADDDQLYFGDFNSIFQGVETLGNSSLPWNERKKLEQRKLEAKGAKPAKKQKMAPDLALRIRRKREAQEELKRQEDLAAGNHVKRSKRKPTKNEDPGLQASEGKFKGGVLYVNPLGQTGKKGKKFKGGRRKK